jgi:hypothetical protein
MYAPTKSQNFFSLIVCADCADAALGNPQVQASIDGLRAIKNGDRKIMQITIPNDYRRDNPASVCECCQENKSSVHGMVIDLLTTKTPSRDIRGHDDKARIVKKYNELLAYNHDPSQCKVPSLRQYASLYLRTYGDHDNSHDLSEYNVLLCDLPSWYLDGPLSKKKRKYWRTRIHALSITQILPLP